MIVKSIVKRLDEIELSIIRLEESIIELNDTFSQFFGEKKLYEEKDRANHEIQKKL